MAPVATGSKVAAHMARLAAASTTMDSTEATVKALAPEVVVAPVALARGVPGAVVVMAPAASKEAVRDANREPRLVVSYCPIAGIDTCHYSQIFGTIPASNELRWMDRLAGAVLHVWRPPNPANILVPENSYARLSLASTCILGTHLPP